MISCILLSAGFSSRFGSPKALANLNGQTVMEHLLHSLVSSDLGEIIIVLGAEAERIKPYILKHKKVKVVYNKHYNFGQTSSFQAGLRCISKDAKGVMLLPVDFPVIKTETINILIKEFYLELSKIIIPQYQSRKGHPPIFPTWLKDDFLSLKFEEGLNAIQRRYEEKIKLVKISDSSVIQTFNTVQELKDLIGN